MFVILFLLFIGTKYLHGM